MCIWKAEFLTSILVKHFFFFEEFHKKIKQVTVFYTGGEEKKTQMEDFPIKCFYQKKKIN